MSRPILTSLFSKFLFRETLTSEEKGYIRSDIGAETAGAAATAQALAISTASGDAMTKANAAQAAAIAASQPLDPDLTAYAGAANSAVRRALIGAGTSDLPASLALNTLPYVQQSLTLTGITVPPGFNPIVVPYIGSSNAAHSWEYSVGVNYVFIGRENEGGPWAVQIDVSGLRVYEATITADTRTPEGLSGWTIITGTGQPSISIPDPVAVTGLLNQLVTVSHYDDTQTEWGCVKTSPMTWLPRTAGIIKHSDGDWYRQTLAADGTAQYDILPNQ